MARAEGRLAQAGTTGMSRRCGRQLSKSERRDVRWALEQAPAGNAHAIDIHGVYVVYGHRGRLTEPTVQPAWRQESGKDVTMHDVTKRRRKRNESAARQRKKDERWEAKVRRRQFFAMLPIVGTWARQQWQLREVREAATAAAIIAHTARERQLEAEKIDLERQLAAVREEAARAAEAASREATRARQRIDEIFGEVARWKRRAEGQDQAWRQRMQATPMDDERAPKRAPSPSHSVASGGSHKSASSHDDTRSAGGTPPAKKAHSGCGDVAAMEERMLLEDASDVMAAKGSARGKGKGWSGKGGGGRGGASQSSFEPGGGYRWASRP